MLAMSKISVETSKARKSFFTKNCVIPAEHQRAYFHILNQLVQHNKQLISAILSPKGRHLRLPVEPEIIEQYLTGFKVSYVPRDIRPGSTEPEGRWCLNPLDPSHVIVFFNRNATLARQRFTKVHELFHFLQSIDQALLTMLDGLILESDLPPEVINAILERSTDKATAIFLMPTEYFYNTYFEIKERHSYFGIEQLKELASLFGVSSETAKYRLQELGQCITPKQLSPMSIDF